MNYDIRWYSQRVTANIHHQLQGWISIFGCLASRTPLVVHFCLYTAANPKKCQQLAAFLLLPGGRLWRHTECRPVGNGTNEEQFLYNDYVNCSALNQDLTRSLKRSEFKKKCWAVYFHSSTQMLCLKRMCRMLFFFIIGFTISAVQCPAD